MGVMLKAGTCRIGLGQDDWKKGRDRQKGDGFRLWCKTAQDIDALADRIRKSGGRLTEDLSGQLARLDGLTRIMVIVRMAGCPGRCRSLK